MKRLLPFLGTFILLSTPEKATSQNPHMTFAMVNACGTEGSGEYAIFYSGDSTLTVNGTDIDFRYGTSDPASVTHSSSFEASGNAAFVTGLNNKLTGGCDFSFVNATAGSTIPSGSRFIIYDAAPTDTADFDSWCGNGLGSVYVLFSTDASWGASGNFANSSASQRFFRTIFKGVTIDYNYTGSTWSPDQNGNYATWSVSGGAPDSYGNFSGCTHSSGIALPVSWLYITAQSQDDRVQLEWATATEVNNDFFTIERSTDGYHWEDLGQIEGAGTSKTIQKYQYTDLLPAQGMSTYRVRQTDFNGTMDRSETVVVHMEATGNHWQIAPNPAQDYLTIKNIDYNSKTQLRLYNQQGQMVQNELCLPNQTIQWEVDHLPAGIYFLHFEDINTYQVQRLVIR